MVFRGNGVVWDKENNKRLCRFTRTAKRGDKGSLETEDKRTIKILIDLGYEHEGETPYEVSKEESKLQDTGKLPPAGEPSLDELKEKAKELNINFAPNIGYDKLLGRVRAAENDS
jgi:hypothetical protein